MSGRPVLSVVMPVHNPGRFLAPCIDSVLGQTFRAFELIAIDDKSTDGSRDALRAYAARDDRVRALANETNLGAARTRNRGLDLARGEFVIFLDADDFFDATYFEEMLQRLQETSADVVAAPIWWRDERAGTEEVVPSHPEKLARILSGAVRPQDYPMEVFCQIPCSPYNKIIHRSFLMEHPDIRFQDLPHNNDTYFGNVVMAFASRVAFLPVPHVHYRTHTGNQISTHRDQHLECFWLACQKIYEGFHASGHWDSFRKAYYRIAMGGVMFELDHMKDARAFLSYLQGDMASKLGLRGLSRQDFDSYRIYGKYQLMMHDSLAFSHGETNFTQWWRLVQHGDFAAAYWLAGHYAKRAARRFLRRG